METKFTPWPWRIKLNGNTSSEKYTEQNDNRMANARLIAAAPRMFDRLAKLAQEGDVESIRIMEVINGNA